MGKWRVRVSDPDMAKDYEYDIEAEFKEVAQFRGTFRAIIEDDAPMQAKFSVSNPPGIDFVLATANYTMVEPVHG